MIQYIKQARGTEARKDAEKKVAETVSRILATVEARGDAAVRGYSKNSIGGRPRVSCSLKSR